MSLKNVLLSGLKINGTDIALTAKGPVHGGSLAAQFAIRDDLAQTVQTELDAVVRDVINRFQSSSVDATLTAGDPGLFTDAGAVLDPTKEVGLARRIAINARVDPDNGGSLYRLRDGLMSTVPGTVGDTKTLQAMRDIVSEKQTLASGKFATQTHTQNAAIGVKSNPQTETKKENAQFNLFLKLMTAQAKNQDPMNPSDPIDFASQLATFTQVEQQIKANTLLEKMVSNAMLGTASLIGKNARIEEKGYFDGTPIRLMVNPDKAATSANLIVKDADGKKVAKKKIELASKAIDWSGKGTDGEVLKAGVYSFSVESFKDGKSIGENVVEAYSEITEVNFADKKKLLTLAGGQTVLLDKIKGLRANS
ncbi:hypothetical protein OAL97_01240 [Paracoccaceae bacterium]|nr:hypothetical protein [Paracoccaceae bacterium]